ncbi:MAG: hypothetical protein WD846_02390 [Patescibacteria group bacterium]
MTPTTISVDEHLWNQLEEAGIQVNARQGVVLQDQLELPVTEVRWFAHGKVSGSRRHQPDDSNEWITDGTRLGEFDRPRMPPGVSVDRLHISGGTYAFEVITCNAFALDGELVDSRKLLGGIVVSADAAPDIVLAAIRKALVAHY